MNDGSTLQSLETLQRRRNRFTSTHLTHHVITSNGKDRRSLPRKTHRRSCTQRPYSQIQRRCLTYLQNFHRNHPTRIVFFLIICIGLIPYFRSFRYYGSLLTVAFHRSSWTYEQQSVVKHPRVITDFDAPKGRDRIQILANDSNLNVSRHRVDWSATDAKIAKRLANSKKYALAKPDSFLQDDGCEAQYDWQFGNYPTCNTIHEIDVYQLHILSKYHPGKIGWMNSGFWRDVWVNPDFDGCKNSVLKTMRMEHKFEERNFDRHRKDAVATAMLSSSPYVIHVHAHCGNSGVYEYASQGTLGDAIWPQTGVSTLTLHEKVHIAYTIAAAIHDIHSVTNKVGTLASIAHTDINPSQFLRVDGTYKVSDFNRCRFIPWNPVLKQTCPFSVEKNPGKFRSPEEYAHSNQTEKIDVFALGNVFYCLLTLSLPFETMDEEEAQQAIMDGKRPAFPDFVRNSASYAVQVLVNATEMCWVQDASKRSNAMEVREYLRMKLVEMEDRF